MEHLALSIKTQKTLKSGHILIYLHCGSIKMKEQTLVFVIEAGDEAILNDSKFWGYAAAMLHDPSCRAHDNIAKCDKDHTQSARDN